MAVLVTEFDRLTGRTSAPWGHGTHRDQPTSQHYQGLLTGYGTEAPFVDALVARFEGRVDDTAGFAMRNRVVLLRASNGTPIDVALGALPFEEHTIERATPFAIGDSISIVQRRRPRGAQGVRWSRPRLARLPRMLTHETLAT